MGGAAHQHHLAYRIGKHRLMPLGHQGHAPGQLPAGETGAVLAVHQDPSRQGPPEAQYRVDEGAFAAAVGAHEAHHLSPVHREGQIPEHRHSLIAAAQFFQAQQLTHSSHLPWSFSAGR